MARVIVAGLDEVARYYPLPHRDEFIQMKSIPQTVLAAPDGSAFVLVDWWWGNPEIRLRTVLSTGAVVETRRSWDAAPVWPSGYKFTKHLVLGDEQRMSAARGRDIQVVTGGPAALWRAHQMHVEAYRQTHDGEPIAHREMVQAVNLSSRLAIHDLRAVRRTGWLVLATVVAMVGVPMTAALIAYSFGVGALLVVLAFAMVALPLLVMRLPMRIRYGRRLRPRFA